MRVKRTTIQNDDLLVNEHCLLYAEVNILLEKLNQAKEVKNKSPILEKTAAYVSHLAKFNNPEAVKEARKILLNTKLEQFEICQIGNLLPEKAEEAKTLVPTIHQRIDDDELQLVLTELNSLQKFS